MRIVFAAVVLALAGLAVSPAPPAHAQAQTQAQAQAQPHLQLSISPEELEALRRDKNQLALYHYGSRYTFDVLLGGIAGGILGATLRGGPVATLTGSTMGTLLGILWFLDSYADSMIEKHGW